MKKAILSTSDQDLVQELASKELLAHHHKLYAAACSQAKSLYGFQKFYENDAKEELEHWTGWRDRANDYGFQLEMPTIKAVDFPEKDETPSGILSIQYKLEFDLWEEYIDAENKADSESLKIDMRHYIKIQRKAVGEYADLLAEIESVGVGFVNQRLQA